MVDEPLRLMCILAHPDDESMGTGGILAKSAAEGIATFVLTATRGQRGWMGDPEDDPGLEAMGAMRESELRAAVDVLGVRELVLLDYLDGDLSQADPGQMIGHIVEHVRRIRPHIVVTFGPEGAYGHPDHIAISQFTSAALVCAADPTYSDINNGLPHRVLKLYFMVDAQDLVDLYANYFGKIEMVIDGETRQHTSWPDWAITTRIDASDYWRIAWQAVKCHVSQLQQDLLLLDGLPDEAHQRFWGIQTFYRAYSMVNGGRELETDLWAGLS